jgi:biopolymer transport protein ExbB/TolQ
MGTSTSLPGWIIATQWASRLVLALLVALSFWSVAIMVDRFRALAAGSPQASRDALDQARKLISARDWAGLRAWAAQAAADAQAAPTSRIPAGALQAALQTGAQGTEEIDRAVRSYLTLERARLEKGLTALATLGSNAPFIGLFGTVLGIIQAFGALAAESSNTRSIMTGISEALVATAIGLFVAIPAVVAYNVYSRKLRELLVESESLRDFYLSRLAPGSSGKGAGHGN